MTESTWDRRGQRRLGIPPAIVEAAHDIAPGVSYMADPIEFAVDDLLGNAIVNNVQNAIEEASAALDNPGQDHADSALD